MSREISVHSIHSPLLSTVTVGADDCAEVAVGVDETSLPVISVLVGATDGAVGGTPLLFVLGAVGEVIGGTPFSFGVVGEVIGGVPFGVFFFGFAGETGVVGGAVVTVVVVIVTVVPIGAKTAEIV